MTYTYLGKMYVSFLELLLLKYNKKPLFLFKNTCNKEKGTFLFESEICSYGW